MNPLPLILLTFTVTTANAGMYKCKVDGKTIYQQSPCATEGDEFVLKSGISKDRQHDAQTGGWREACGAWGKAAKTIMENRQSNVSMAKMMQAVASNKERSLAETIIVSAYESPRYSTQKMQKRTVEEFRDKVYLECVKVMREKDQKQGLESN